MQIAHQQSLWGSAMASATENTTSHAMTSDTNDGFFGRPVKLDTFAWKINEPFYHTFNPWAAFCEDPRVVNRLAHFKNARMTLHVQAVINGNPFYYGRAIMSYIPLPQSDSYSETSDANGGNSLELVPASQRPHVYLDPCKSEGGEITCPFLYPKTYMDIPTSEWEKMGLIVLQDINPLYHANDQGDSVDVTIFAYASEVSINTPTCQTPNTLVPQGQDEYGKISYPAHLVANWAGRLANAPIIGAYARATEMIANATAGVASMFGYSRPNAPADDICTMRLYPSHATTNERDDAINLAVDCKREITIDPRVCGLSPQDEMALVPMAMRESYFGQFPWTTENVPDDHLCSIRISPMLGQAQAPIIGEKYALTPMAFVAHPFKYWKGSIIVRMQVVCSAYNRGRLRVVWDPDHCNANCNDMFNTNYSMLLDITESQDITFRVGWGANTDYLPVPPIDHILNCFQYSNYGDNALGCNGTLSVYVVNGLTVPGEISNPVSVNLFACADEDFEVAVPDQVALQTVQADSSAGPPQAPTDGPGGGAPVDPQIIVAKREFAFGMIYPASDVTHMKATNYDNRTQAVWIQSGGARLFTIPAWGGGVDNVTSGNIVLEFRQHQQTATDIDVVYNGTSYTQTLPGSIGATRSITIPVTLVDGTSPIALTIENTSRVILNYVTSYFPQTYERVFVRGANLLPLIVEPEAAVSSIGSYTTVENQLGSTLTVQAPSDYAVGTRGWGASTYGFSLNGIDNPRDGNEPLLNTSMISAPIAVGDQWALTQGTSTSWLPEFTKFTYWRDTSLPSPQGNCIRRADPDSVIDHEEDNYFFSDSSEDEIIRILPQGNDEYRPLSIMDTVRILQGVLDYFQEEKENCDFELVPQGDDTPEERNDDKDDANAPEHEQVDLSMGPSSDVPGLAQIYFGEQCTSWRQLLKRYQIKFDLDLTNATSYWLDIAIPPSSLPRTVVNGNVSMTVQNTLLDYVAPAYVCMRGSVKYRFSSRYGDHTRLWATRLSYAAGRVFGIFPGAQDAENRMNLAGGHMFDLDLAHVPAVEAPWYSRFRFHHARQALESDPSNFNERDALRLYSQSATGGSANFAEVSMAVAEDFSLCGFLAVPYLVPR